jgi:hypothetical protein
MLGLITHNSHGPDLNVLKEKIKIPVFYTG